MWNHSSTSTVRALARARRAVDRFDGLRVADDAGSTPAVRVMRISGRGSGPLGRDEVGNRVDRAQDLGAGLLVRDRHAERPFELQDELEHVDGIEAKPLAEEGHAVADLLGRNRQSQAPHECLLHFLFEFRERR